MDSKNILPIWQPVGCSTNFIAQKIAEKLNTKTSHTGTIDPMAQGVIIVLLGEERLKKYEYAKWIKGYEFEIIFGIATDTYDGMGKITKINLEKNINAEILLNLKDKFLGKYLQKIPPFSTKKIKGKHMHEYARKGQFVEIPIKAGKLYQFILLDFSQIKTEIFVKKIIKNVQIINGDFRQNEIIEDWKNFLQKNPEQKLYKAKFYVETSKGIYIRSLSQDICKELDTVGFVYNLKRIKNGKYSKQNSAILNNIV